MKKLIDFFKKIFTLPNILNIVKSATFAYIIVGIFAFTAFRTCQSNKDLVSEKTKTEQNLIAANDTAKYYKNKYNESVTEKSVFIMTVKELKKQNDKLYQKVKQQDGNIISLSNAIIGLKQDTAILRSKLKSYAGTPKQVNDSTWYLPFTLTYNWDINNYDKYTGQTKVQVIGNSISNNGILQKPILNVKNIGTELLTRESNIDVTFGEKVVNDKYVVYIQSAYPGFTAKSLEGFMVDPNSNKYIKKLIKKQHWFTGWSLGLGATPGYEITTGKFGLCVGPTLQWNIYNW